MARLERGVLVAFEGIDGSGKTTQANLLDDYLRGIGVETLKTKEPTSGPWGLKLRESKKSGRMEPREELRYFIEDRREHVTKELRPALDAGLVVIVDRYYYSTVAYQGARGLDPQELLRENRSFAPTPDLMVLLDLDPEVGLERIRRRGNGRDLFENLEDLAKARRIFQSLTDPHILKLDGERPIQDIHREIVQRLSDGPVGELVRRKQVEIGPAKDA